MGIYIKGMEMPKGCYECPLMDGEYGDCKVGATGLYDQYKEDCPLTKVSEPHGRLIDVDACIDYIRSNNQHAWETLAYAPTVIEGSEPLER